MALMKLEASSSIENANGLHARLIDRIHVDIIQNRSCQLSVTPLLNLSCLLYDSQHVGTALAIQWCLPTTMLARMNRTKVELRQLLLLSP